MNKLPMNKPNRLAKLVHRPGGMTASEAAAAGDAALATIRDDVVRQIGTTLDRMEVIGTALLAGPDNQAMDELYTLANTIVGMAGVFGMGHLGEVAFSMCNLIDRLKVTRKWDGAAVQVHLNTLRVMRPGAVVDQGRHEHVIEALRRVVSRLE